VLLTRLACGEVWEKDMSNEVYIEASSEGFVSVQLTCGKKRMVVEVEMEEDFDGVIYTRGSFMSKPKGCFLDAEGGTRQVLKIPFDKCGVKQMKGEEEGWIGHTLVVQHDDWLIFPGDLAFTLQCNHSDQGTKSRIGLADPDPSSADKEMPKHKKSTVEGGETVTFTPDDVRPRKKKKKSQEYVIEQKTEL